MINREEINDSTTMRIYKEEMARIVSLYYQDMDLNTLNRAMDYSIQKRYNQYQANLSNSYTNSRVETTLLKIADFYHDKEPITTAYGTMFKKHGTVPNPFGDVIQEFLDLRNINKKKMFKYVKGSEEFEHYNLLQQLDKIDANGIYGLVGLYTSLVYNVSLASSITAQGRSFVSNAGLFFESFLSNSVKFGSLNELISFIDNVIQEKYTRKFNDYEFLDRNISIEECFSKLILTCGFNWVPSIDDLDIVWNLLHKLSYEDINRLYYKNNLYEFMSNSRMKEYIRYILRKLDMPYVNPLDPPESIKDDMDYLSDILKEYVYYGHMYMDRIDKMDRGIKCVCAISDTDSCIVSMDAWYHFCLDEIVGLEKYPILEMELQDPFEYIKYDEFNDIINPEILNPFEKIELDKIDYDFYNDEIIKIRNLENPFEMLPQDNMRYTILSIMGYVCDKLANNYMELATMRNNSYRGEGKCRIILKNEFLFKRALITSVKKSYATIQELQEGNSIPQNIDTALDIKGIPCMLKSTMSEYTREALKKIMYEDILNSKEISQINVLKHMAILEKNIISSLQSGSKEYYTPATVKAISTYKEPLRMYGVKAILVWNALCRDDEPKLDIDKRNGVDIAKININKKMVDDIDDPILKEKCINLLESDLFRTESELSSGKIKVSYKDINSIAIPREIPVPKWIMPYIDYDTIINKNLAGFPLESINCNRLKNDNVIYSNILKL